MSKNRENSSRNSPELSKKINQMQTPDLEEKIDFLRACWVEEQYLNMFATAAVETTNRLVEALWDNPTQEEVAIVNGNMELVKLRLEQYTTARVREVTMLWANNSYSANDDLYSDAA